MEFKIGDKVKFKYKKIGESVPSSYNAGGINVKHGSTKLGKEIAVVKGKYDKYTEVEFISEDNRAVCLGFYENDLELVTRGNYKPKTPTHVVIWEEDNDPAKLFTSEKDANDFIKELTENSDVKQDSIILLEVKSAKKVKVNKVIKKSNLLI